MLSLLVFVMASLPVFVVVVVVSSSLVFRNSLLKVSLLAYNSGHSLANFSFSSSLKFVREKFLENTIFSLKYAYVIPSRTTHPSVVGASSTTPPLRARERGAAAAPPYVVTDSV